MDSLYEELVVTGLIKKSVLVTLNDYIGEPLPCASRCGHPCPSTPAPLPEASFPTDLSHRHSQEYHSSAVPSGSPQVIASISGPL